MSTITAPEPINVAAFTPELIAELRMTGLINQINSPSLISFVFSVVEAIMISSEPTELLKIISTTAAPQSAEEGLL